MIPAALDGSGELARGLALGVTLATVSDTRDPKGLGRIKLRLRLKGAEIESDWAQIASLLAGPDYGAFMLPQVDDTALVAFADGDASQPFVLGFLWNGAQKPPLPQDQQQNVRVIKTRQGKTIVLDDSPQGRIRIVDEKDNEVLIDTAANRIAITSQGDLAITAKGQLSIVAAGLSVRDTTGNVKAELTANSMQLSGGASMTLQATMIDLN